MSDEELRRAYQARATQPSASPPTPEQLAGLASGEGSEEERAELLDRALADPATARDFELLRAITAAERSEARPAARRWAVPLTLAASLLLAVAGYVVLRPARPDDTVRAPAANGGSMLVEPQDSASLAPGAITFTWRPAPRAASYRLELLTEAGALAMSQETFDTTITVPVLEGGTYRWLVVGLLPDGLEAPSRPRRLLITP
jgi:hypothetical protein